MTIPTSVFVSGPRKEKKVLRPNKPLERQIDIWFVYSTLTIMFDVEIGLQRQIYAASYIYKK